ncbi:universal stress protein [Acinetobacter sp. ANC 4635]|uniref:universal stress protein n=1 Tax=Acinetobacter sp. ANC 4635 TaxID=2529846 RepID=UPI0010406240|nr:universal stress protein [Acinetobacter sp. ANC 4635]TCB30092.1 universal stress protein [Acinetobacter sp. ANC 4635]
MINKNILVPIDGSDQALAAVKQAAIMATALDSKLMLISIVEENPFSNTDFYYFGADATTMKTFFDDACRNATDVLAKAEKLCVDLGANEVETKLIKAEVSAKTILNVAEEFDIALIIMGSHGRKGIQKLALGSVAEEVLKLSKIPVLIVK